MSRVRNFLHAIWSGYLLAAVSALLNFITNPIALATLGKPAFGLWAAVMTAATFSSIFDLGVGPSLARFVTDYKDNPQSKSYADFLKSVFFVGLIQGLFFCVAVLVLIHWAPGLMGIDTTFSPLFKVL